MKCGFTSESENRSAYNTYSEKTLSYCKLSYKQGLVSKGGKKSQYSGYIFLERSQQSYMAMQSGLYDSWLSCKLY